MVFLLYDIKLAPYLSIIIFIVASATDGIDGYVARKYNQITTFGKFIDPLADKLLVTAALIGLVWIQKLDPWFALIIISREFIVTSLRIVAISNGKVVPAALSGKIKTVLQISAIIAMLIDRIYAIAFGNILLSNILMVLAVLITVYSGVEYVIKNKTLIEVK